MKRDLGKDMEMGKSENLKKYYVIRYLRKCTRWMEVPSSREVEPLCGAGTSGVAGKI